jgi:hypothetical protein
MADNARPTYQGIAGYISRRAGIPTAFVTGVPWQEQERLLDQGQAAVGFICGLLYTHKIERAPLLTDAELTFVGFFGQRRFEANPALLQDVDTELIQEFLNHPYVLSYCSLELADNNWANIVILRNADGIQHWRASRKHAYAARELAPQYYTGIRLHNGILPNGLASPYLVLLHTKYYDFQGPGLWQAVREERGDS